MTKVTFVKLLHLLRKKRYIISLKLLPVFMKKIIIIFSILSTCLMAIAQKNLYPKGKFDKNISQEMLATGTSTIEGIASTKQYTDSKKFFAPEGTIVTLFPLTPYIEEFIKLRRRKENVNKKEDRKKTYVYMSNEAFEYRLEAKTDANGGFKFDKLKPGKYYIECIIPFTAVYNYQEQTGVVNTYNQGGYVLSSTPNYETFQSTYGTSNREWKIVEIKKEGENLQADVSYTLRPLDNFRKKFK